MEFLLFLFYFISHFREGMNDTEEDAFEDSATMRHEGFQYTWSHVTLKHNSYRCSLYHITGCRSKIIILHSNKKMTAFYKHHESRNIKNGCQKSLEDLTNQVDKMSVNGSSNNLTVSNLNYTAAMKISVDSLALKDITMLPSDIWIHVTIFLIVKLLFTGGW